MSKVTVIGAGNVGATCANAIAHLKICSDLVLLDIKEGLSEGKAIDMMQTAKMYGFNTRIKGVTNDYAATRNSDVVVITSGIPRKPGMTREELIGVNAGIVNGVVSNALKYSPKAIFIIISNPMDTMTYLTLKATGLPKNRVIGMGGQLDSNRFCYYLSQALKAAPSDVEGIVIGGHGDDDSAPEQGDLQEHACDEAPHQGGRPESRCIHDGWRRYPDQTPRHLRLVCTGCFLRCHGQIDPPRREESIPLLLLPGRRVWPGRPLHRRSRCDR